MAYEFLAGCYDRFTADVDYPRWADYIEKHFSRSALPIHTVLDLACGTGSLTLELYKRGVDIYGIDGSVEMLSEARTKCAEAGADILFLCQNMLSIDLYGTVDAAVCALDSLNYVTKPADCRKTFRRVYDALTPGGLFVFDINTPAKLRGLDGQVFLDETDDTYCVWRTEFDEKKRLCYYGMDIFRLEGDHWQRSFEEHIEYAYEPAELQQWLAEAGFTRIRSYGDRVLRAPKEAEQRIYFSAKKE